MKILMSILVLTAAFSLSAHASSKTVCSLGIGTDDGRDLAPDFTYAMQDSSGKDLNKIELKDRLIMRSDMIIADISEVTSSGDKEVSLGIDVPGVGPVFVTNELSRADELVELTLDLRSSKLAEKLGRKYDQCDSDTNDCLSNIVILTCGPQEKVEANVILKKK